MSIFNVLAFLFLLNSRLYASNLCQDFNETTHKSYSLDRIFYSNIWLNDSNRNRHASICYSFDACKIDDPFSLFEVTKKAVWENILRPSVTSTHIITSVTDEILSYSSFALTINYNFALFRHYSFSIFTKENVISNLPRFRESESILAWDKDARWNKIKFLIETIESFDNLDGTQTIVWLDADLVVADFSLSIELIMKSYLNADIIMSKDKADAPFVSNTGSIIVRNSPWALRMLRMWWGAYDRSRCCDQNALTWLYDRKVPEDISQRMVFLPANVLNTDFPAWTGPNRYTYLLHLAGVTSLYRIQIFHRGFKDLCEKLHILKDGKEIALSLDYQTLQENLRSLPYHRLNSLRIMSSMLQDNSTCHSFDSITLIRSHLANILKYDDDEDPFTRVDPDLQSTIEELVLSIQERIGHLLHNLLGDTSIACDATSASCKASLELAKDFITICFETAIAAKGRGVPLSDSVHTSLSLAHRLIEEIIAAGHPEKITSRFVYYLFKHHQLRADYSASSEDKATWLLEAANVWRQLVAEYQYFGTDYVLADPQKEYMELLASLGILQCELGSYSLGLQSLQEALKVLEDTLSGYARIRIAPEGVERVGKIQLAEIYFNIAICTEKFLLYEKRSVSLSSSLIIGEYLDYSIRLLEAIDARNETLVYQLAQKKLVQLNSSDNNLERGPTANTTARFRKRKKIR